MLLAADIGGTKTRLAVFSSVAELRTPLLEKTFPSTRYSSLEALVQEFLAQPNVPAIQQASFGVAGPVLDGSAKVTNLPWTMNEEKLQQALRIPSVCLLNDLSAMAHAIPLLEMTDLRMLNEGKPEKHGTLAVIAPGTGLGEAFLLWDGCAYQSYPSEGGHADFAPTDPTQIELLSYLLKQYEHVSYEQVISGHGIPHIYNFLKQTGSYSEPAALAAQFAETDDPAPVIVEAALSQEVGCEICVAALKLFAAILGAETGNLVLKVLATGGVYIGGGIPPRILSYLESEDFMKAFRNKGRFSDMLSRIPVHAILNPDVALIGAAAHGFGL